VDELAVIGSSVRRAAATTVVGSSTGSSAGLADAAVEVEGAGRAGLGQEVAALSLAVVVVVSHAVVSDVPAGTFEEGEGELGYGLIVDKTRSHGFGAELSSFEVGTSSSRGTGVLHVSTLESRASEMVSESSSEGFSDEDLAGTTAERGGGDGGSSEVLVQTGGETEGMGDFVDHADHILFVEKNVAGFLDEGSVDSGKGNGGSLGSSGHEAGHGIGDPTEGTGAFTLDDQEEVGVETVSEDGRSGVTADAAGGDLELSRNGVLVLQGLAEVVKDGREELVLEVVSVSTGSGT